jgi:hypothetical protein
MFLMLCALACCSDKAELIQPLAGAKSDSLEVQAGGLVLREGEAGAAFGTARVGKDKRQMTYFAVDKHDLGKAEKSDFTEDTNAAEEAGDTKQVLSLDGRTVEISYKVTVKAGKKVGESLTVKVNGKAIDAGKGRVLLIDLTQATPTVEAVKADLPEDAEAGTKRATEELAGKVLASLAKQDKKVAEFIEKAKK